MRSAKLNNFLPSYPFYKDTNLNYDLFKKQELYKLKLGPIQDETEKVKNLFKEQEYITRFISSYTPYDGIILVHATGTGKTCAFFGAVEALRNQQHYVIFDKAVVLAPTPIILDNLKQNLVEKCSQRYETINQLKKDPFYSFIPLSLSSKEFLNQFEQKTKHTTPIIIIDEVHRFISSDKFYDFMMLLHQIPSKKIIVGSATPMVNSYDQIFKVMALLTPFSTPPTKEVIQEFEKKYNKMILKKDKFIVRIDNSLADLFKGRVSYLKKSINTSIRIITNPEFKISLQWTPEQNSEWNFKFTSNQLKLLFNDWYLCTMKSIQNFFYTNQMIPIYKNSKSLDLSKNELPIQASLFVFPKLVTISDKLKNLPIYYTLDEDEDDGDVYITENPSSYYTKMTEEDINEQYPNKKNEIFTFYSIDKKQGELKNSWKHYIEFNQTVKTFSFKTVMTGYSSRLSSSTLTPIKHGSLKNILLGKNRTETLENIKSYSIVYYNILKRIINHPKEKHFVYISVVKGSGAILFALLLNLLGYKYYKDLTKTPYRNSHNYILLNSLLSNTQMNRQFIEHFNNKYNAYGKHIQVIIGGKAIATGIDLKHVRHIHIATPDWNFTNIKQAIGRGIRSGSHDELLPNERSVSIYKYVPCPEGTTQLNYIVYGRMYIRSFYKDLNIKQLEYFMKINAVNCPVFYKRNYIDGTNYTQLCDYKKCEYKCADIPIQYLDSKLHEYILPKNELDKGNQLLFLTPNFKYTPYIQQCFRYYFCLHFSNLKLFIERQLQQEIDGQTLLYTLYEIIEQQIPFNNQYGYTNYLNEQHHHFYLDRTPNRNQMTNSYYQEWISLSDSLSIVSELKREDLLLIFAKIATTKEDSLRREWMYKLPHYLRIGLLKKIVTSSTLKGKPLNDWLRNYFRFDYFMVENTQYIRNLKSVEMMEVSEDPCKTPDKVKYKLFYEYYNKKTKQFEVCDEIHQQIITTFVKKQQTNFINRAKQVGYYGIFMKNIFKKETFKILELKHIKPVSDSRSIKTGRTCWFISMDNVRNILTKFNVPFQTNSKTLGCLKMFNYFNTNNLIMDETYIYNPEKKTYEFIYLES